MRLSFVRLRRIGNGNIETNCNRNCNCKGNRNCNRKDKIPWSFACAQDDDGEQTTAATATATAKTNCKNKCGDPSLPQDDNGYGYGYGYGVWVTGNGYGYGYGYGVWVRVRAELRRWCGVPLLGGRGSWGLGGERASCCARMPTLARQDRAKMGRPELWLTDDWLDPMRLRDDGVDGLCWEVGEVGAGRRKRFVLRTNAHLSAIRPREDGAPGVVVDR